MAIRAEQITFRRLFDETGPRAWHSVHRDGERLGIRVAVMEDEGRDVTLVTAADTPSAV
jgi:SH3-like domain-containing protein